MDRIDGLLEAYRRQLSLPWRSDLSGAERVWIAVYPPDLERRVRAKLPEFELATKEAGKRWTSCDLTTSFSTWLGANEYREAYFDDPSLITPALSQYLSDVQTQVQRALDEPGGGEDTITAVLGVGTLFPMVRVSDLIQHVSGSVRGRLLVLFPGSFEDGNYRLLDARDGWNYLAIPIMARETGNR